ncbi:hypothetical protein ABBQ38_006671 [Trebouxia sp. C0009 RCD-2024]
MPFEHIEQRNVPVIVSFESFRLAKGKKQFWYALSVLCSMGVTWVLAARIRTLAVWLKLQPCSPKDACFILAKLSTGATEFCPVERSNYRPSIAWLQNRLRQSPRKGPACLLIRIQGDAYSYSGDSNAFTLVPRMPLDLPEQLESALHQLRAIDQEGASWETFNPLGSWPRIQRALVYGQNQKFVRALSAKQLVPGDVIVVQRGRVICDMVLLRGTCLVEESMLSGEASQIRKVPHTVGLQYDPDVHLSSTLHAGSHIEQVWVDDDERDESLAMVVRTGEYTTTGNMLRPLIHNKIYASSTDDLKRDRLKFLGCSLAVNLFMFLIYLLHHITLQPLGTTLIFLQLLRFVLNALPPLLASLLIMLRFVTVLRLRHQNIFLSDTRKLQTAAQLDLVAFDKTGTLTLGQGHLHGVVTCEKGMLGDSLKMEAVTWSGDMRKAIALCSDLMPLKNGRQVVGPNSEKKAFADVEAAFVGRNAVCLPIRRHPREAASFMTLQVLHRLEFDAEYLMSGVIAEAASARQEGPQIFLKGSVHAVVQLVAHNRLPWDWAHVMMSWNAKGYRTMGVVSGTVVVRDQQDITKISLANVNDHVREMSLLGILVFSNPLRSDSVAAVAELHHTGRLKTMMVTGDHSMTGIAALQQVGMLSKGQPIVIFDKEAPKKGPTQLPASPNMAPKKSLTQLPARPDVMPKAAASIVSPLSDLLPQAHCSLAPGPGRESLSALSSSSMSSCVSTIEAADAAAYRASLRRPKFVEPAAMSISSLPSVADFATASSAASASVPAVASPPAVPAFEACALHAPSLSWNPLFHDSAASSASNTPAVAIAAPPMQCKSSSLLAPASAAGLPFAAGFLAASSSAAFRTAPSTPSPLLASYLRSMSGAKRANEAQSGFLQDQSELASQPGRAHSADEQLSGPQAKSHKLSRFSIQYSDPHAPGTDASNAHSDQLFALHSATDEGLRLIQGMPEAESHSSQTHSLRQSPFDLPQLKAQSGPQSRDPTQLNSSTANQLRSCLKGRSQPEPPSQEVSSAESDREQQRKKTSLDPRQWAVEQSKKQHSLSLQGLALSGMRASMEVQSGHRNRSLDLVRADTKNTRLSFDSATLPKDEKLRCMVVDLATSSVRMISSKEAFDTVAAGSPCVITGFAFEHMVKEVEAAQVELTVRSAVLCARMKAHQKSQLVHLLSKGLQIFDDRTLKGLGHTVAYCGDGINDIAALHAADLGIAIGATQAMVAAPVFTPAESATVVCTLIKEARCSMMVSHSLFKYMALYGFVESALGCVAFLVADTNMSIPQYECMDFTALCLSLAALCTRPAKQLHAREPASKLMSIAVLAPLLLLVVCYSAQQAMAWHFTRLQSWYKAGRIHDAAVATSMLVALFQLLLPAIAFFNDMRPHCMGFRDNPVVPAVVFAAATWWGLWAIVGKGFLADLLWLDTLPDQQRLKMIAFGVLTFGVIKMVLIFTRWAVPKARCS